MLQFDSYLSRPATQDTKTQPPIQFTTNRYCSNDLLRLWGLKFGIWARKFGLWVGGSGKTGAPILRTSPRKNTKCMATALYSFFFSPEQDKLGLQSGMAPRACWCDHPRFLASSAWPLQPNFHLTGMLWCDTGTGVVQNWLLYQHPPTAL